MKIQCQTEDEEIYHRHLSSSMVVCRPFIHLRVTPGEKDTCVRPFSLFKSDFPVCSKFSHTIISEHSFATVTYTHLWSKELTNIQSCGMFKNLHLHSLLLPPFGKKCADFYQYCISMLLMTCEVVAKKEVRWRKRLK